MHKADLVDRIADSTGLTKDAVSKVVDTALITITAALARGEEIALAGFGSFSVAERSSRVGRNPQTGAAIEIAASKAPTFKASKKLKDAVNA